MMFFLQKKERFVNDVERLKKEILDIANMTDSFGNSLFGGVSGEEKPFSIDSTGNVSYVGSALLER